MPKDRPNVIIICSDTYRPDHIAANGHPWIKTPELDEFVEKTINFEGGTVSSFPTIPMRTDWLAGRFSHPRHGWRDLDPKAITMPQILSKEGYTTQLIADTTHLLRSKFWQAYDHFHFERGHEGDRPFSRLNTPIEDTVTDRRKTRIDRGNHGDRPAIVDVHKHTNFRQHYEEECHVARLSDVACRWVEDNHKGGPFFLWVDSFDVHEPWTPPEYIVRKYDPSYDGEPMMHPNYDSSDIYSPEELKNLHAHYAGECTMASKHIGRVLRIIEDTRLMENTIVLFTSDHGMYVGERGRTGKSAITPDAFDVFPFYREIANICWSMHVPQSLANGVLPPGTRMPQIAQAPDVLPTVLELCGIEQPKESDIEGISLVPWITGQRSDQTREIAITTWTAMTHHSRKTTKCRRPTVTDGTWTLLIKEPPDEGPPELYNVADDPNQTTDLISEHKDEAKRLHTLMLDWLESHEAGSSALERLSAPNVGLTSCCTPTIPRI